MGDLSPHFSTAEMSCSHCGRCKISGKLIIALEQLRVLGDEPIVVNDGYRCPEHNLAVGGVRNSEHVSGLAADIRIMGLTLQQMYDRAKSVPAFRDGGIGAYDTGFIHVDVRKGTARWARVQGRYVNVGALVNPFLGTGVRSI